MFFSIIIPTYNPKIYLQDLLMSLARNRCRDDMEIIISDDCSDDSFEDIVSAFSVLNIRIVYNDKHFGFPRNGRQHGLETANGKWICFADQDDCFVDNAFDKIKAFIETNHVHNYLTGSFIAHNTITDECIVYDGTTAWTHGKFYEKEFLDKYRIAYDNVRYCEDVNLTTKLGCTLIVHNISASFYPEPVYVWNQREDSLSQGDYFIKSMPDYINGTLDVIIRYIEQYQENPVLVQQFIMKFVQTLYHVYFYCQCEKFLADKKTILETALIVYPIYERFKKASGWTTDQLIAKTNSDWLNMFAEARHGDFKQSPFVEQMTFKEWAFAYLN